MYHKHYIHSSPQQLGPYQSSTITDQNDTMSNTNSSLRFELARLEAKLDIITNLLLQQGKNATVTSDASSTVSPAELSLLRTMTAKQHITAQLLIEGWANKNIGDVLNIAENTVKLHVRAVCKKVGTKTRGQAALVMHDILERVDPTEYARSSGGIPIDWARTYDPNVPDQYEALYRKED